MCSGNAPELEASTSFVGRWMDILRPGYERLQPRADDATALHDLEQEAVLISLENLMTFPFVADAVERGDLTLHGLWKDITNGSLLNYDTRANGFVPV